MSTCLAKNYNFFSILFSEPIGNDNHYQLHLIMDFRQYLEPINNDNHYQLYLTIDEYEFQNLLIMIIIIIYI